MYYGEDAAWHNTPAEHAAPPAVALLPDVLPWLATPASQGEPVSVTRKKHRRRSRRKKKTSLKAWAGQPVLKTEKLRWSDRFGEESPAVYGLPLHAGPAEPVLPADDASPGSATFSTHSDSHSLKLTLTQTHSDSIIMIDKSESSNSHSNSNSTCHHSTNDNNDDNKGGTTVRTSNMLHLGSCSAEYM